MSDTEKAIPNKTGASGAPWTDNEKIAYLLILCEHEGKVDAKIAAAPIPANRSVVSCKKLLMRLKEKHKDDIAAIKAGTAITATIEAGAVNGDKKTHRKRKSKANEDAACAEDMATPTKKAKGAGRKKKSEELVKEEAKEDEPEDVKVEENGDNTEA